MQYKDLWGVRFPEHSLNTYTSHKMEIIAEALSEFYCEKIVRKICGLNFARFLEKSLPS